MNNNPAQRILKTALKGRKSALKPINKKSIENSSSKNKKIVDYFPIVSTNNGVTPLRNTSTRTAFNTPRIERVGYITEMSSADSDNGPITSADELESMPPPKRRCLRVSTRPSLETNDGNKIKVCNKIIFKAIMDLQHDDLVWATLEDGARLPGRVIDPRLESFDRIISILYF